MKKQKTKVRVENGNPANAQPNRATGLSRTSAAYWKERVEQVEGRGGLRSPNYSARIIHQKKRVRFPLSTPNKEAAATKAAQIFKFLIENDWEATIAKFKPHTVTPENQGKADTVGGLITAANSISSARPQTKEAYAKAFRRIVAGISGIEDGRKYDGKRGGFADWREAVDAIKLASITPAKVLSWKNRFLEEGGKDPKAKQSAKITVNSLIRNAKALFAKKHLSFLAEEVALPFPLPFSDIPMEKQPSMRYQSKIDAVKILEKAMDELAETKTEEFKALILALMFGLRISEIDHLLWEAFDFENGILRLENTEFHELKSADSAGEIDIDEKTLALFRGFRAKAKGKFVVESPNTARSQSRSSRCYRCDRIFNGMREWLREQGVTAHKPIHELRKEIGSIIASEHGLFEASRYLRHGDIRITAAIYLDKKKRITPSLGSLMGEGSKIVDFEKDEKRA